MGIRPRLIVEFHSRIIREPTPEEKEDEMEDFIDFIRLVVNALGRKVFEPVVNKQSEYVEEVPVFHSKGQKATASGKPTDDGFVVLK
ncbi:MAG: hypothetical protein VB088_14255, partial [Sphaerochaeta sp.]|nr:hypothetical protein [Sphaerochaeta sp.]